MALRKAAIKKDTAKNATTAKASRAGISRPPSATDETVTQAPTTGKPKKVAATSQTASKTTKAKAKPKAAQVPSDDSDREPIRAFLRIRPNTEDNGEVCTPYIKSLSDTTVQMTDPSGANRIRLHPQAQNYTFNHVFPPETDQADFFQNTTLPLVQGLLQGQNGLIFTYGVTNSGKTYTIQGGTEPGTAGLLPRTLDVVFNSVQGLLGQMPYRPVRLAGVEHITKEDPDNSLPEISDEQAISAAFGELKLQESDSTKVTVDKNYEYSIWISYAEVYNEKVYDLLASDAAEAEGTSGTATPQKRGSALPRSGTTRKPFPRATSSTWQNLASLANSTTTDVLMVKRKALTLKNDPESGGKYVAGLKCVKVSSAEEAKHVFRTGNINRRVFGTLANAVSSRSHGIFTLRAVRMHRADHSDITVSRLSIVDLAGSERTKNTQNTGERLKEAGSINKSLMVLGQCMEAMRSNQRRLAAMLSAPGRGGLDLLNPSAGVKLAIVPFRHSKLTELFQDFFIGDHEGRAVMIVNVNPYDTGFDENSHVMRFAALAKEVTTTTNAVPPKAAVRPPSPSKPSPLGPRKTPNTQTRKVTISTGGSGNRKASEAQVEIIEEDEDDDESGEPIDFLVDALFEELEDLRIKLYESEMRAAVIEAETREEVMQEMHERMMSMEQIFAKRLRQAVEQNEAKTDAKIDMLQQFGIFRKSTESRSSIEPNETSFESGYGDDDTTEGEIVSFTSKTEEDDEEEDEDEDEEEEDGSEEDEVESSFDDSKSSPLSHKPERTPFHHPEPVIGLRDEDMTIDQVDADETMTVGSSEGQSEEEEDEEDYEEETSVADEATSEGTNDDEEDWTPPPKQPKSKGASGEEPRPLQKQASNVKANPKTSVDVGNLQKKMDVLSLFADEEDKENIGSPIPSINKGKKIAYQANISVSEDPVLDEPLAKSKTKQAKKSVAESSNLRRSTRHLKH